MPVRAHESNPVTPVKLIPSSSELWVKSAGTQSITLPLLKKLGRSLTSPEPEYPQQVKLSLNLILEAFFQGLVVYELNFRPLALKFGDQALCLLLLCMFCQAGIFEQLPYYTVRMDQFVDGGRKRHKWGYQVQNPDNCNFYFKAKFLANKAANICW